MRKFVSSKKDVKRLILSGIGGILFAILVWHTQ